MASSTAPTLHPDHISPLYVKFIVVASVMTTISTICTGLRFFQRLSMGFMWDDWCLLGSLIFAFGFMATTALVATLTHAGYHINEYVLWELRMYMKVRIPIMRLSETMRLMDCFCRLHLPTTSYTTPVSHCPKPQCYSSTTEYLVSIACSGLSCTLSASYSWDTFLLHFLASSLQLTQSGHNGI